MKNYVVTPIHYITQLLPHPPLLTFKYIAVNQMQRRLGVRQA